MKKIALPLLFISIVLFAGCTVKPAANYPSNRAVAQGSNAAQPPASSQTAPPQASTTKTSSAETPPAQTAPVKTSATQPPPAETTAAPQTTPTQSPGTQPTKTQSVSTSQPPSEPEEQTPADDGDVVEITEKMFIAGCNDVYLNPDDYKGKTIKLQGIYDEQTDPGTSTTYHFVIRYGPGCCGNDGVAGFEILYDGEWPSPNDWIEATGKAEVIKGEFYDSVVLCLTSLSVLSERGAEFVTQ